MGKLSNVVTNEVVKKTDYDAKITEKENKIPDTSNLATKTLLTTVENKFPNTVGLVKKTGYNAKIAEMENKTPDTSNLATKTALTSVENKIPDTINLATKTALTAVENKILDTGGLIKKANYNAKTTGLENKIPDTSNLATKTALTSVENKIPNIKTELTTVENKIPDISNLATKTALTNLCNTVLNISALIKISHYDARIKEIESKFVINTGFDSKFTKENVITKINFDAKITEVENNIKTFTSSYFRGKIYFDEDDTQNYLVFLPIGRYFRLIPNKKYISSWKSKGLSDETITPYVTSDNSLTPWIDYYDTKIRLKFNESCLNQSNTLT